MRKYWIDRAGGSNAKSRAVQRGMGVVLDVATHEKVALGTCFSEEDDLLSQWRGYADNGSGYSLTFCKEELDKIPEFSQDDGSLQLIKIAYGEQDFDRINEVVRLFATTFLPDAQKYSEADGEGSLNLDFGPNGEKHKLWRNAAAALYSVKNGAFHEEKEWRLFMFGSLSQIPKLKFREVSQGISPYRELEIPKPALAYVTLGPRNDTPPFVVRAALTANGFENVDVRESRASYR